MVSILLGSFLGKFMSEARQLNSTVTEITNRMFVLNQCFFLVIKPFRKETKLVYDVDFIKIEVILEKLGSCTDVEFVIFM